jgi:hypothetical protein
MSLYAHVYNGEIVEFKELNDTLYQNWISTQNPKANVYRLVVDTDPPEVTNTQVAVSGYTINETTVEKTWTVRNKTADEMRKVYTAYEFLLRFTAEERTAYRNAAKTDEIIADFMYLAHAAQEIITDDPMTMQGMDYLVFSGILTQNRRDEILS